MFNSLWAGGRTCCAGGSTYCISGERGDNVVRRNLQLDNYRAVHRSRRDVFNNWLGIDVTSGCHLAPAPLPRGSERRARTPAAASPRGPRLPAPARHSLRHTPPGSVSYELTSSALMRTGKPWERDDNRPNTAKGYVNLLAWLLWALACTVLGTVALDARPITLIVTISSF